MCKPKIYFENMSTMVLLDIANCVLNCSKSENIVQHTMLIYYKCGVYL